MTTATFLLVAGVGAVVILANFVLNARKLTVKYRFNKLHATIGQSAEDIEAIMGHPSVVRELPNGKRLVSWNDYTGNVTLQFDGGVCECIIVRDLEDE